MTENIPLEKLKLLKNKLTLEIRNKKEELYKSFNNEDSLNLYKELLQLESMLEKIEEMIIATMPGINDGIIELIESPFEGIYYIKLLSENKIIGKISYRGYHYNHIVGDIGYEISEPFRGNGYAYLALCILSDILKNNGVQDFWISVSEENIASVRTISKYGGNMIWRLNDINLYICKTRYLQDENILLSKCC